MCILFEIGVAMHTVQLLLYSDSSTAVAFVLMMQASAQMQIAIFTLLLFACTSQQTGRHFHHKLRVDS